MSFHLNIIARQTLQAAGGVAYLFHLHGRLAALVCALLVASAACSSLYGALARRLAAREQDALAAAASTATTALGLVRTVRTHAAEAQECGRCARAERGGEAERRARARAACARARAADARRNAAAGRG